jgi:DNA polymerase III subunit alpha
MQCGRGRMEDAVATARWYSEVFPDRYYIELQENTLAEQDAVNKRLLEVAGELKLPLVATNDCHYLNREDARAHEVLLCIQTGKTMSDPTHMKFTADEFYVKSPEEMARAFSYAPEAIANTVAIAERCDLELPLNKEYYFPHISSPLPARTTTRCWKTWPRRGSWNAWPPSWPSIPICPWSGGRHTSTACASNWTASARCSSRPTS